MGGALRPGRRPSMSGPSMSGPLADRLREKARDRVAWTELVQLVKTVVAAVVAWILAAEVLDLPQPFLAPWSALLVVHATVYSTFSRGAQQVGATVIGVVVAWGIGNTLGLDPVAIAVLLLVGMVVGQLAWVREEGTTVAATALIVLTTGYSDDGNFLLLRLADTAIGIAVGVVVNLLVWPPFRDRAAARAIDAVDDRIGELLREMADGLRHGRSDELVHVWVDRTTEIDEEVDQAWALVRQSRESGWFNPRRSAREVRNPTEYGDILHRIEQSVAETRSMARSLDHSVVNVTEWDPVFKDRWVGLLDDAGAAILAPDSARQGQIRERLSELIDELSTGDLPTQHWPEYGGLILNLRNIVGSMDVVAKANPVRVRRGRPLLRG